MKYFTTIRKNLATCSYYPNQTCFFDTKRLAIIFVALLTFASFFKVLIDGADNITDYIYSAYFTTTMICAFCSFIYTSIKTPTIFALIHDDTGEIMKKSRSSIFNIFLIWLFKNAIIIFARNDMSGIEKKIHQNPSIDRENKQNDVFCDCNYDNTRVHFTKSISVLFHLFRHRFWTRCIWIVISNVVKSPRFLKLNNAT